MSKPKVPKKYPWYCPYCTAGGDAASKDEARQSRKLHIMIMHPLEKVK